MMSSSSDRRRLKEQSEVVCCISEWLIGQLLAIAGLQDDITPLHVASKWGRSSVISLLVDSHANIEAPTKVSQSHTSVCACSFCCHALCLAFSARAFTSESNGSLPPGL